MGDLQTIYTVAEYRWYIVLSNGIIFSWARGGNECVNLMLVRHERNLGKKFK